MTSPPQNQAPRLSDGFGRVVQNLRISITDKCNFRCIYCMPVDPEWLAPGKILRYEEIHRLVRIFVGLGVWKVRVTGGEPTVRRDLPRLIELLSGTEGLRNLGMTTNGLLLPDLAKPLYRAGLRKLNISLDSLDSQKFHELTRRDALDRVLLGLRAARDVGFGPIKVNCVVMRGINEDEVVRFVEFGRDEGYEVRFIEFMPLDADDVWDRGKVYSQEEILRDIARSHAFDPVRDQDPHAPATEFRFRDGIGSFGIIGSVSQPFCTKCDRVRVTADGKLRTCLFSTRETDLIGPLRDGVSDEEIARILESAVRGKQAGHAIDTSAFDKPVRTMHQIGG